MKPSEIFEGENSGLRKAFDEAVARGETSTENIDEMVRDFCSVAPKSKSEVRQRISDLIHQAIAEERAREEIVIRPTTTIKSFPISFEWDGKQIDCIETYYIDTKNTTAFDWSLGTFEDELIEDTSEYSLGLNFFIAELSYEECDDGDYATGQPPSGGHSVNLVRDTDPLASLDKTLT